MKSIILFTDIELQQLKENKGIFQKSEIEFKDNIDKLKELLLNSKPMTGKELQILKKTASRLISDKPTHL